MTLAFPYLPANFAALSRAGTLAPPTRASGDGAYVCQLTITAPAFELRAGGAPAAVAVVAAVTTARSSSAKTGAPAAPAPAAPIESVEELTAE